MMWKDTTKRIDIDDDNNNNNSNDEENTVDSTQKDHGVQLRRRQQQPQPQHQQESHTMNNTTTTNRRRIDTTTTTTTTAAAPSSSNRRSSYRLVVGLVVAFQSIVYLCATLPSNDVMPPPPLASDPPLILAASPFSSSSSSSATTTGSPTAATAIYDYVRSDTIDENKKDRYVPTTILYSLPSTSSTTNSSTSTSADMTRIEHQVWQHYEIDPDWQQECVRDNATQYIQQRRQQRNGGAHTFFARACATSGLHPTIHWNPFQTHDHHCAVTTSIELRRQQDHLYEAWSLHTYASSHNSSSSSSSSNNNNNSTRIKKEVGGDTFYIVYEEYYQVTTTSPETVDDGKDTATNQTMPTTTTTIQSIPLAVGIPQEYYNGTYGITNFYAIPFTTSTPNTNYVALQQGRLRVYPITTCFIGELYPPLKDGWTTGGHTNISWSTSTTTMVPRPWKIIDRLTDLYYYHHRRRPTSRTTTLHNHTRSNSIQTNNLKQFDRTVFFGDSLVRQMIYDVYQKDYYHQRNENLRAALTSHNKNRTIWTGNAQGTSPHDPHDGGPINVNMPLSTNTVQQYIQTLEDAIHEGLVLPPTSTTTTTIATPYNIGLVLGSSAWDILWPSEWQGPNTFVEHLAAIKVLVRYLRTTYPHVTIVWKLPYANHMHQANPVECFTTLGPDRGSCVTALRYATLERFHIVYTLQKQLFLTNDDNDDDEFTKDPMIHLLDLYQLSYVSGATYMIPNDSLHYLPQWNSYVLQLLYQ